MGRVVSGALPLLAVVLLLACQNEDKATIRPAATGPEAQVEPKPAAAPAPAGQARSLADSAAAAAARVPSPPHRPPDTRAARLRSQQKGFVVATREDCLRGETGYDLVVHFHGVADAVERQWNAARLGGVVAIANAGTWGRDYKAVYEHAGAYQALLRRVEAQLAEICPDAPRKARRIALSGWSAGYAAIRAMLRDASSEPIDAVLLSDGIHASLSGETRDVLPSDVAPFVEFGKRALRGEKLMSITHSAIRTPDYASTTETTDYLLEQLGLVRRSESTQGSSDDVRLASEAKEAGFHLRGYTGETGPEHGWHLHALESTLFADLKRWWSGAAR